MKIFLSESGSSFVEFSMLLVLGTALMTIAGSNAFHVLSGDDGIKRRYATDSIAVSPASLLITDPNTGKSEFLYSSPVPAHQTLYFSKVNEMRSALQENGHPESTSTCFTPYMIHRGIDCDSSPTAIQLSEDPTNPVTCTAAATSALASSCTALLEKVYTVADECVSYALCLQNFANPYALETTIIQTQDMSL